MFISLPVILGKESTSQWALGFIGFTSTCMVLVLFGAAESPRFLILQRQKFEQGRQAMKFYMRGDSAKLDQNFNDLITLSNQIENEKRTVHNGFWKKFKKIPKKVKWYQKDCLK